MDKNNQVQVKIPFRQKIILIIFGLVLVFILLEAGLRLGGFIITSLQEYRNWISLKKGSYRIICLGESTTRGQYPSFLEEILNQSNTGIKFSVIDKGVGGSNTSVILDKLESNLDRYLPNMVITMMGINDSGTHMPYEVTLTSKQMIFFRSFRTYKLTRLLWLHIVTKAKELGFYKLNKDRYNTEGLQWHLPKIELKEVFVKRAGFTTSEDSFRKAIELNPKNDWAYVELGRVYRDQGEFFQARNLFKKAIELNPKNDWAYVELGWLYRNMIDLSQAEKLCNKALELNPKNSKAYGVLGWVYRDQGKLSPAEDSFKKAIELDPKNDIAYGALALLYTETGNFQLAGEYDKKTKELRLKEYNPITVNNYHKLKEILDTRGIRLVCVQYPVRSIEPLKKIFEGQKGIIFVDNEKIFKDALQKASYKEYFRDMFVGDFGHCTAKGNRLLAENIADVILKEVFDK